MYDDLRDARITGGITQEPQLSYNQAGTAILKLNVGCSESRKNKTTQEYENKSHYFECVVFGRYAEVLQNKLVKGSKVAISGDLTFSQWQDGNGNNRNKIVINANKVKIFDSSTNSQGNNNQNSNSNPYTSGSQGNNRGNNSFQSNNNQRNQGNNRPSYENYPSGNGGSGNFEDDIPFMRSELENIII